MHTLLALMVTVAASVVIARPPGPVSTTTSQEEPSLQPSRKYLRQYLMPQFPWPPFFLFEEDSQEIQEQAMPATEWLNQEIERLSRINLGSKPEIPRRMLRNPSYYKRWPSPYNVRLVKPYHVNQQLRPLNLVSEEALIQDEINELKSDPVASPTNEEDKKKQFAFTPNDKGYYDPAGKENNSANFSTVSVHTEGQRALHEYNQPKAAIEPVPPRPIRQNPNLSRHSQKSLIAENLGDLRAGFAGTGHEEAMSREHPQYVSKLENASESPGTFYGVALLSAIGAAAVLAVLGFVIGWYTLAKRAKLAADVDYPAYGVTGPTLDTSGDRKLAHSAHMYHYQHQKQQIIAMERSGMEQRSGSVSDPESDDENEEGDYTVYECPGFATTGDMEVKNPLFNEEPTPATPGKCEVVKPQPKN